MISSISPILQFFAESAWAQRVGNPGVCDFTIGNPHEMPMPAFVEALQRWSIPQDKYWYAYKQNESSARAAVAKSLRKWRGLPFEDDDIFMTNGAIAALLVVFSAIIDPGDEVIFVIPPWFQYEGMITHAGGVPVKVKMDLKTFDLDLSAIERALTRKTRAIIVNSPHNPSGKIYPPETLSALARVLESTSERNGRTIYLISDEAYSRIIFDGREYPSPTAYYPDSFLVYTYGKVLLTPGQRIGFIALPPTMSNRNDFRAVIPPLQMLNGWAFPNALLQHSIGDLDNLSVDIAHLRQKRDRLVSALRDMGYEASLPEGAFYVLVRSPWDDDRAFVELLAEYNIFCIPGMTMELPGYFRISLTANDEMIERAIPGFAAALSRASETGR
jgi:aspartate aminotransferase